MPVIHRTCLFYLEYKTNMIQYWQVCPPLIAIRFPSSICPFCPAPGKCSHGGAGDRTSTTVPRGGISKDERRSDNMAFHNAAVNAATAASLQLLDDIRLAAGNNDFLRYGIQIWQTQISPNLILNHEVLLCD